MDDPLAAVGVPAGRGVFNEVVADADDEVGPIEARHDVVAGLEADGHEREVRAIVDRALAHERDGDRDMEPAGERPQLRRSAATEDAVAGEDEWPLGGGDEVGCVADRLVGRFGEIGLAGGQRRGVGLDRHRRQVLGQLDVGRPGLFQDGGAKRLSHDLRDCPEPLDACVPLGDRLEHPDDVDDLVGFLVELFGARLPGDRDHRRSIEERIRDAGDEVRRPRPEGRHRDGGPARQAAVDVGHERGALLVAGRDVAHGAVVAEGIEDVHRLLAGHGEDVFAALGGEAIDEQMRGGSPLGRGHGGQA